MSGDMGSIADLTPIVEALQDSITSGQIVDFFATGVMVALPLILTWFRMQMDIPQICFGSEAEVEVN